MSPISFLLGTVCLVHASAIAIIGYVPDYRFNGIDWNKVVSQTTHLVLFSAEPRVDGLRNLDVIRSVLQPNSALSAALQKAGSGAPKLLVSVGGAGRSQEFPDVIGNKKTRKRLAKQLLNLMQELPQLAGIDFDLQVQNPDHLSLAKLVMMLRTAVGSRGGQKPIFTMTFHALVGVLNSFATLTLKQQDSEEKRFVDLFDLCHAMTYTMMDQQGRHSSEKMDADVVQAWLKYGLPLDHLTLGLVGDGSYLKRGPASELRKHVFQRVFKLVDKDRAGFLDFDQFGSLIATVSDPEKVKTVLTPASAQFLDYRSSVDQDPSFAKHFPIPRPVKACLRVLEEMKPCTRRYNKHFNQTLEAVRWVADGTFLAATGNRLLVCDISTRSDVPLKCCEVGPSVYCMDALPGGRGVLLGYGKKTENLMLWDMAEERAIHVFPGLVTSISMADDGNKVCTTSRDGQVVIFDINAGSMPSCVVSTIQDAAAGYTVCDALWCGDDLLSAGDDYCIKMWDARKSGLAPLASYMGHTSCVRSLALSPDGSLFASGAADSSVRIWAVKPYGIRDRLTKHPGSNGDKDNRVIDLLLSLKERREQAIELVHAGEGDMAEVRQLTEEIDHLESVAKEVEDPCDSDLIDSNGYIRAMLGLAGHSLTVNSLAWQEDQKGGNRIVTGAHDESVCLFEFADAEVLEGIPFFGVKNGVAPVTFKEIISQERSFASSGRERTKDGFFFVNAENAVKKVKFAEEQGIAGLMIWELGQDAAEESISLLRHIWDAAKNKGILHQLLGITPKEDHLFSVLTVLMGGYYFLRVMQLAMKPSPQPLKSFPKAEAPEEKEEKEETVEKEKVKEEKKDS
eukprot:s1640_g8.t2